VLLEEAPGRILDLCARLCDVGVIVKQSLEFQVRSDSYLIVCGKIRHPKDYR
jgi:hypothetical protein